MNIIATNKEPFRAERKLSSFNGASNHLISLFCPKGFFVFREMVLSSIASLLCSCLGYVILPINEFELACFIKNPTQPIKSLLRLSTHRANINTTPIKVVRAYHQVSGDSAFERAMSCCERRANLQLSISL